MKRIFLSALLIGISLISGAQANDIIPDLSSISEACGISQKPSTFKTLEALFECGNAAKISDLPTLDERLKSDNTMRVSNFFDTNDNGKFLYRHAPVRLKAPNKFGEKVDVLVFTSDVSVKKIMEVDGDLSKFREDVNRDAKRLAENQTPSETIDNSLVHSNVGSLFPQTIYLRKLENGMLVQKNVLHYSSDEVFYCLYFSP